MTAASGGEVRAGMDVVAVTEEGAAVVTEEETVEEAVIVEATMAETLEDKGVNCRNFGKLS